MAALPFTVIGGYLGAGKTTLLNNLLAPAGGLRLAVLVNDFGSVNIDVGLIRSHDGDTINLANGCMCCSLVNGFASAIGRISERADDFDHIVIEASGVADPGKVAEYGQMYRLPLDAIVVVVDAEQVRTQARNKYVGETVLRQFARADLIVVNKVDLVSVADLAGLRGWLASLAPATPMIEAVHADVPVEVLLGSRRSGAREETPSADEGHADHAHAYQTWTLERPVPLSRDALTHFAAGLGEDVYRAKGFVCLEDDPDRRYVYQQVGARWSLQPGAGWDEDPRRSLLVVIGRTGAATQGGLDVLLGP